MFDFLKHKISEKNARCLVYTLLALFTFTILYTAWVVEDAFITFRTVDNFWNGYGLRWNIDERVMTYTHPLWMMLLLVIRGISNNIFIGSLVLCFIFTFLTIRYLVIYKKNHLLLAFGLLALLSSRAFIDYSTSGLENPLVHFLILTLIVQFLIKENKNIAIYSFIVGLILLTRLDLVFLVLPICLYVFYFSIKDFGLIKTLGRIFLGAIPFFSWCLFATYYYGSFIPNTAWAKLNHGIDNDLIYMQGYLYYLSILKFDPLTFFFILLFPILFFLKTNKPKVKIVLLGIITGLFYVFSVGADYMLGRFISVYLLTSVALLVFFGIPKINKTFEKIILLFLILLFGMFFINSFTDFYIDNNQFILLFLFLFLLNNFLKLSLISFRILLISTLFIFIFLNIFSFLGHSTNSNFTKTGILDERNMYWYDSNTLLKTSRNEKKYHDFLKNGYIIKNYSEKYYILPYIGMSAYIAGEKFYFIDPLALGDIFLAQYPIADYDWRIGHFPRYLKKDYLLSVINEKNMMSNINDKKVLDDVWLLSRAPLNNPNRIGAIIRLHSGEIKDNAQKAYYETLNNQMIHEYNIWGNWKKQNISN